MPNDLGKHFAALSLSAEMTTQALEQFRKTLDESLFGNILVLPPGVSMQEARYGARRETFVVPTKTVQALTCPARGTETTETTTRRTRRIDLEDA